MKDLTGQVFNYLEVTGFSHKEKGIYYWKYICICGEEGTIAYSNLNRCQSCGCLRMELIELKNSKRYHNMSFTQFYSIWSGMKTRCLNKNTDYYIRYGGRGILLCNKWLSFKGFKEDMYESYLKHVEEFGKDNTSLDRILVNGNYEPGNCKWATNSEQVRNRRDSTVTLDYTEHMRRKQNFARKLQRIIGGSKLNSSFCKDYLGCNEDFFRNYIQSLWTEGMTWNNYGCGIGKWCIDHIKPCHEFDLSKDEDCKICYSYMNLQPLWFIKNLEKNRIECYAK